jgi:hypothetical protein
MATDRKKKEETAMQVADAPGALVTPSYGADAGAGFEQQTSADVTIPFITLLQSNSPLVKDRAHPMALDGNMVNTVTEEYYDRDRGVLFVPATTRHLFAKWVPRDRGGGFRGHLEPDDPIVLTAIRTAPKFGKYQMIDEEDEDKQTLQLSECFYIYGIVCDENGGANGMALLGCSSMKITPYKKWNSRLRRMSQPPVGAPMYANLARVVADPEKNAKGSFFVFGFRPGDPRGMVQSLLSPDDPRFVMAKACRKLVDSGEAKVDFEKQDAPGEEAEKAPF